MNHPRIKLADEVWLATALLHSENPDRADFTLPEIVERAAAANVSGTIKPGIYPHVALHCVANRPPNPGRYRMLYETRPKHRRLFRPGDTYDPQREGAKMTPNPDDLPSRYASILQWYETWSRSFREKTRGSDPLLALYGSGKELWADEHADAYIARLRAGWE